MKKVVIILSILLVAFTCFSQSAFDIALKNISYDLANKLKLQERKKVVVLFVTDINKATTNAGTYLADNISFNLVNDPTLKIFERENLSSIEEAKNLIKENYISAEKTKELGKLLAVNAIVVGNYTILSNTIKLSLKALSTDNGSTVAASMMDLPINADACALLGIKATTDDGNFSKNPKCEEKNIGDYCFQNNKPFSLYIRIKDSRYGDHESTIQSGEKQCFYDLPSGEITYFLIEDKYKNGYNVTYDSRTNKRTPEVYQTNGSLYIVTCQRKTYIIK